MTSSPVVRASRGIARAREISRAAVTDMRQNLAFAFICNALGVPVAAGLLYPGIRRIAVSADTFANFSCEGRRREDSCVQTVRSGCMLATENASMHAWVTAHGRRAALAAASLEHRQ